MKTHDLKCDSEYFQAVVDGLKPFELRKNDRSFRVGDVIHLRETEYPSSAMAVGRPLLYTGRELYGDIEYIMAHPALVSGYVAMTVKWGYA